MHRENRALRTLSIDKENTPTLGINILPGLKRRRTGVKLLSDILQPSVNLGL